MNYVDTALDTAIAELLLTAVLIVGVGNLVRYSL